MKKNVIKATLLVFVLSFIAKIIGFIKSIIQASYFGATYETDAFNIASGFVSNILYMFTMAVSVAFVPLYIQHKQKDEDNGKKFATKVLTVLFIAALFLSIVLLIGSPIVVRIIAPSYTGEIFELTNQYFKVLVIGFSFSLVANMYTNLLNAEKIYGFSSFASIINSIVLIVCIMTLSKQFGVWALVISIPLSYFIQWVTLSIRGRNYASISVKYGLKDDGIKILLVQALPVLISQATVEINQVVDRALLTSVGDGTLTAVSYAAVLYQFATTLISTPLSTVMFTELSEAGAKNDKSSIKSILLNCYKVTLIICIPVIIVMFYCSYDIVEIVYGHGNYSDTAIFQTSVGLKMYGLCLLPVCIKTVLSRAYYAMNDTKRPMIISVIEVALNIILSILLVKPYGIIGVVGATAIASFVLIIVMLIDYNKNYISVITWNVVKDYWKIAIGALVLGVIMYVLRSTTVANCLVDFLIKSILVFVTFFAMLVVLKDSDFLYFVNKIHVTINRKVGRSTKINDSN